MNETSNQEPTFSDFWAVYPRRAARKVAERSWNRLSKRDKVAALEALPAHVALWEERDAPEFIPHPSTWLNQGRWEDELPTRKEKPKAVPVQAWWTTEQGTIAYGASKGLPPRPGEGMSEYRERLRRVA